MSFEDELERRFGDRAAAVDAVPDLSWVESEAGRRHRRRRRIPAAAAAFAVVALGLVGTAHLVDEPPEPTADVPPSTDAPRATDGGSGAAASSGSTLATVPALDAAWTDAEAPYLEGTVEVYRRDLGGRDVVVRRSERSWAELFDLEWRAPTGSAELCTGDRAMFIGDPLAGSWYGGSAWVPVEVFDDFEGEVVVDDSHTELVLVRTSGTADEVAVVVDGTEYDRAAFVDGLALLDMSDVWGDPEPHDAPPSLALIRDGEAAVLRSFEFQDGRLTEDYSQACVPGAPPELPLPPAGGEQPADPEAAAAEVLEAYDRARDRSVLLSEEDPPSVDDITGIEAAAAEVDAGQNADLAAAAVHTVDELVFTTPTEAWFRYTITTGDLVFDGRFGTARFDGSNWQITRDTICQDLQLAGGTCVPASDRVQPPEPVGWAEVMAEYERSAELYWSSRGCLPEPFGPGPCDQTTDALGDG